MSLEAILGPDGAIARRLQNYEQRPQQVEMAQAVAHAIASRTHLLVEAGTGVGKSFAYLVPAIQAAMADPDCRVVVSTNTISLQEQLIQKDLPFLQLVMAGFRAVLVKGRSNYLSRRRLQVAAHHAGNFFAEANALDQLRQISHWAIHTKDGSRSDLEFEPIPAVWSQVESDGSNCLSRKCPTYAQCFYFKARRQMQDAQVLVVNHALLFSDLALRCKGSEFGLLPKFRVAILDEGHTVEDIAALHFGLQVSSLQIQYFLTRLFSPSTQRGLLAFHGTDEALRQVSQTRFAAEQFFEATLNLVSPHSRKNTEDQRAIFANTLIRVRKPLGVADLLSEELRNLGSCLQGMAAKIEQQEEQIELAAAAERSQRLAAAVQQWLTQDLAGQVYWIETEARPARTPSVTLACAPIEVGTALRQQLYEQFGTVVLTSATLSTGGPHGLDHFRRRLGLENCTTLQLGSPFNYRAQAELHLFRNLPDPRQDEATYEDALAAQIQHYVARTSGRAFVLFTNYQLLRRLADRLREWLGEQGLLLLAQGDGLPRQKMLERFRATGNAVIFGVDSFWQGVDVPGEALSNVIITKLPFPVPTRPLIEARMEAITTSGGNAFLEYLLPQAILKLKQGVGRLIRTRQDRGLIVLLDPRVLTKHYGEAFLRALPECRRCVDGVSEEASRFPSQSSGPERARLADPTPNRSSCALCAGQMPGVVPPLDQAILECVRSLSGQLSCMQLTRLLLGLDREFQEHPYFGRYARQAVVRIYGQVHELRAGNHLHKDANHHLWPSTAPDKNLAARVHALGESGSVEHVPELIQALEHDSGNVRRLAASALGKLRALAAVESLLALLRKEQGPQVRQYAIKALGKIGDPRARKLLEQICADEDETAYNRQAADAALRSLRKPPSG
jgi:ATP-dependent DNA helicase DinG